MSLNTDIFSTDLSNVIDDLPAIITISGTDILGMAGTVSKDDSSGMLGIAQMSDVEFSSNTENFATAPKPKDRCTHNGEKYIIDRVSVSAEGVQTILYLTRETGRSSI